MSTLARLQIVPENWHTTRVFVVPEHGDPVDISSLVSQVTWVHAAGELPTCTLQLLLVEPEDFAALKMAAVGTPRVLEVRVDNPRTTPAFAIDPGYAAESKQALAALLAGATPVRSR